jgi:exopolyphosphatase/guanosine-5'-triphosphate,3'-diphosphate pyrophosphatase
MRTPRAGAGRTSHPAPIRTRYPFRAAAIDVGSNAIRFAAARFVNARRATRLASARAAVRLGRSVFDEGRLSDEAMDAALESLSGFRARMDGLGIQGYRAVATSAVREAANAADFLARVRERTGLELDIIDAAEEARLVHLAVRDRIPMGRDTWLVGDLGGGSLEVSLATRATILWTTSRALGAVRLGAARPTGAADLARLREIVAHHLPITLLPAGAPPRGFIGIGGGIKSLAVLAGVSPDSRGVATLPSEDVGRLAEHLSRLSVRRRVQELGLPEDRADVIVPAAIVYARLAEVAQADTILVPGVGVLDGVLLDLQTRLEA